MLVGLSVIPVGYHPCRAKSVPNIRKSIKLFAVVLFIYTVDKQFDMYFIDCQANVRTTAGEISSFNEDMRLHQGFYMDLLTGRGGGEERSIVNTNPPIMFTDDNVLDM